MTTTTRNEAAQRLLALWMPDDETSSLSSDAFLHSVDEALAAERRAMVERIRERLLTPQGYERPIADLFTMLDEEAAR